MKFSINQSNNCIELTIYGDGSQDEHQRWHLANTTPMATGINFEFKPTLKPTFTFDYFVGQQLYLDPTNEKIEITGLIVRDKIEYEFTFLSERGGVHYSNGHDFSRRPMQQ